MRKNTLTYTKVLVSLVVLFFGTHAILFAQGTTETSTADQKSLTSDTLADEDIMSNKDKNGKYDGMRNDSTRRGNKADKGARYKHHHKGDNDNRHADKHGKSGRRGGRGHRHDKDGTHGDKLDKEERGIGMPDEDMADTDDDVDIDSEPEDTADTTNL